jgi:hypothetical protein
LFHDQGNIKLLIGALGCVGSRFLYHEIIPEELAKKLLELIQEKAKE